MPDQDNHENNPIVAFIDTVNQSSDCTGIVFSKGYSGFNAVMSEATKANLSDSAIDRIVLFVGKQFMGIPYVGGVLDTPETERTQFNA